MAAPGESDPPVTRGEIERRSAEGSHSPIEPTWERPVIWAPTGAPAETVKLTLQLTRQFQTLLLYEKYIFTAGKIVQTWIFEYRNHDGTYSWYGAHMEGDKHLSEVLDEWERTAKTAEAARLPVIRFPVTLAPSLLRYFSRYLRRQAPPYSLWRALFTLESRELWHQITCLDCGKERRVALEYAWMLNHEVAAIVVQRCSILGLECDVEQYAPTARIDVKALMDAPALEASHREGTDRDWKEKSPPQSLEIQSQPSGEQQALAPVVKRENEERQSGENTAERSAELLKMWKDLGQALPIAFYKGEDSPDALLAWRRGIEQYIELYSVPQASQVLASTTFLWDDALKW